MICIELFLAYLVLGELPIISCDSSLGVPGPSASDACDNGLAAFDDVTKGLADAGGMHNGETGWISGYADLSPVLAFDGCFDLPTVKGLTKLSDVEYVYNLNYCSKYCANVSTRNVYIGLKRELCYCLRQEDRNLISGRHVNLRTCYQACNATLQSFHCSEYVGLYQISRSIDTSVQGLKQCIYISKPNLQRSNEIYGTASCHTIHDIAIHGFICNFASKRYCNSTSKSQFICLEDRIDKTWMQAEAECERESGILVSTSHSQRYTKVVPGSNTYYWIGAFRAIAPSDVPTAHCLAVTRVGDQYLLDTDGCGETKRPVCLARDETAIPLVIIGLAASAAVVVLVGLGCVIVWWKRRGKYNTASDNALNKRGSDLTKNIVNTDVDEHIGKLEFAENNANEAASYEMIDAVAINEPNEQQQNRLDQANEYAVVTLHKGGDMGTATVESPETNLTNNLYDHVDLKRQHVRTVTVADFETDAHVYSHVILKANEGDYDTTTVSQSVTNYYKGDYDVIDVRFKSSQNGKS